MFGFNPTNFSDPFDVNKVAGTHNRERAKLKSQAFLTDSEMGGNALATYAKNKAGNIMAKANKGAQSTMNNAALIGGALDFAGSLGSFGAAGGFGNFGGGATSTSGIGSGTGQASLTPGVDTRSAFHNRINPIAGFGGVMNG